MFLNSKNKKDEKKIKEIVVKVIFNSANHKKLVKSAARASSVKQQSLRDRYNKAISS